MYNLVCCCVPLDHFGGALGSFEVGAVGCVGMPYLASKAKMCYETRFLSKREEAEG